MILLIEDFQLNFQVVSFKKKEKCTLIIGVNYELRMVWSNVGYIFIAFWFVWNDHDIVINFSVNSLVAPHQVWLDLHRWNQENVATTDLIPPWNLPAPKPGGHSLSSYPISLLIRRRPHLSLNLSAFYNYQSIYIDIKLQKIIVFSRDVDTCQGKSCLVSSESFCRHYH